jgi:hypothetical protein
MIFDEQKVEEIKSENEKVKKIQEEQIRKGLDKEVKAAINAALSTNILKEDSLLAKNIAETWSA